MTGGPHHRVSQHSKREGEQREREREQLDLDAGQIHKTTWAEPPCLLALHLRADGEEPPGSPLPPCPPLPSAVAGCWHGTRRHSAFTWLWPEKSVSPLSLGCRGAALLETDTRHNRSPGARRCQTPAPAVMVLDVLMNQAFVLRTEVRLETQRPPPSSWHARVSFVLLVISAVLLLKANT